MDNTKTAVKTSIKEKPIENAIHDIKTEIDLLKAAFDTVSTNISHQKPENIVSFKKADVKHHVGLRVSGISEPTNPKSNDRMRADLLAI